MANANQNKLLSPINIINGGVKPLLGFDWEGSFYIPVILDNSIETFIRCYLNIDIDIKLDLAVQNIAATSTVPIYIRVKYWITSGPLKGKWLIDNVLGYAPGDTPPAVPYAELDPLLQNAFVLVPTSGDNYFGVRNYELKNRRVYREEPYAGETLETGVLIDDGGFLAIEDGSKLFFHSGYFEVFVYYVASDSRRALGGAVTDANIEALQCITSFSLVGLPSYLE